MSKPVSPSDLKRCLRDGYTRFVDLHADDLVAAIKEENLRSISVPTVTEPEAPASLPVPIQTAPKLLRRPISISTANKQKPLFGGIMDSVEKRVDESILVVPEQPLIEPKPISPAPEATKPAPVVEEQTRNIQKEELAAKLESIIEAGPISIAAKPAKKRTPLQVEEIDLDAMSAKLHGKSEESEKSQQSRPRREKDTADEKKQKYKKRKSARGRFVTFSK